MSEFEIQQLFIATRWEFDIPTMLFVFASLAFISLGLKFRGTMDKWDVRLLQLAYVFCSGFLFVRAQAAIVRASRLTELLMSTKPAFTIATPAFQQPTYFFRYGSFIVLFVVTLVVIQRSGKAQAGLAQ